jgi:hypothetical protein
MAKGEGARTAKNLRHELHTAKHIINLTRASLPILTRTGRRSGEQNTPDPLLRQLAELDSVILPTLPADGQPSLADIIIALPDLTTISHEQSDALDAALKQLDKDVSSILAEHDGAAWRERAEALVRTMQPYLIRVSLSVAAGLLATAVTAPLAGQVILTSLLIAAVGLLITAICAEAQALLPQSRPAPGRSERLVERHMDLAATLRDLRNQQDRASDPQLAEEWLPLVRRSALTATIIAIDIDQEIRKFAWAGTPRYLDLLHATRMLLIVQASAPSADDETRERLTELADRIAASHPPGDLRPIPGSDRPLARRGDEGPSSPSMQSSDATTRHDSVVATARVAENANIPTSADAAVDETASRLPNVTPRLNADRRPETVVHAGSDARDDVSTDATPKSPRRGGRPARGTLGVGGRQASSTSPNLAGSDVDKALPPQRPTRRRITRLKRTEAKPMPRSPPTADTPIDSTTDPDSGAKSKSLPDPEHGQESPTP